VFYHIYEEPSPTSFWPKAVEFQIETEHTGDVYAVGPRLGLHARRSQEKAVGFYDPTAELLWFEPKGVNSRHCIHNADFETAGWNTIELICLGAKSIHVVNGHVVLRIDAINRQQPALYP